MDDSTIAPPDPPRQGLTYFRVMALAHGAADGGAIQVTTAEFNELLRAWLRLTDIDPDWQRGGDT